MTSNIVLWLANGERGVSSNTIFTMLTGINALGDWHSDHPHDPDDLRRCRLLLEQCPQLKNVFPEMAMVSKEWKLLVKHWDSLCETMDIECPEWREKRGSAPKTYAMMKEILYLAKKESNEKNEHTDN